MRWQITYMHLESMVILLHLLAGVSEDAPDWPVLQVLCLDLSHLAAGEVKHFLAEQLEDCHVVLTEAFAGSTGSHYITDKGGPVFGPLLFQNLQKRFSFTWFSQWHWIMITGRIMRNKKNCVFWSFFLINGTIHLNNEQSTTNMTKNK